MGMDWDSICLENCEECWDYGCPDHPGNMAEFDPEMWCPYSFGGYAPGNANCEFCGWRMECEEIAFGKEAYVHC